jgi:hypothetical protein
MSAFDARPNSRIDHKHISSTKPFFHTPILPKPITIATMPSFLDLPPELRAIIFELALTHDGPLSISGIYPDYHGLGATTTLKRSHLAPTQINRLLRYEALPIFYGANTFTICLQPVCVRFFGKRKGRSLDIFRRSCGGEVMSGWFKMLPEEAVRALRRFRVYVACVTRWRGDEGIMEREKCWAYDVAEARTRGIDDACAL